LVVILVIPLLPPRAWGEGSSGRRPDAAAAHRAPGYDRRLHGWSLPSLCCAC